jgi:hypothetical protein
MSNVINFRGITRLPLDPARVIGAAVEVEFERVMIIGLTKDGQEYFAASDPDGGCALWDMERARYFLMKIADDADD